MLRVFVYKEGVLLLVYELNEQVGTLVSRRRRHPIIGVNRRPGYETGSKDLIFYEHRRVEIRRSRQSRFQLAWLLI